ncbi:hypothetical protein F5Y12DRAFT_755002 [Xylaria sp. FL1777]|nr:hypothetical protein F5Y12DRAFT_755002 [Xylaria sp. FL1777]
MLFSIGRSATRRLASTALATSSTSSVVFRAANRVPLKAPGIYRRFPSTVRGYAAAARPKKASASATAKKTTTKKPAKKSTAKTKTATKAKAKPKSKAKAKPKAKAKARAKAKPKAKPKRKAAKRPISPERQAILERRALKRTALFTDPKLLPTQAWSIFVAEQTQGQASGNLTEKMNSVSQAYKALPSSELERLKSKAEQDKGTNATVYKRWVESHSVQEIYDANKARKALKRKFDIPKGNVKIIHDERLPKRPGTAYTLFTKARWASGDYPGGVPLAETTSSIGREWKSLNAAQRKPYEDLWHSETEKYNKAIDGLISRRKRATKSPSP